MVIFTRNQVSDIVADTEVSEQMQSRKMCRLNCSRCIVSNGAIWHERPSAQLEWAHYFFLK